MNARCLILVVTLLLGTFMLSLRIHSVNAGGIIYIRADGSIDPPTAPVSTVDNVTYILTSNIASDADGIVVERSNIIIDGNGYTLQGPGNYNGFNCSGISNVTIQNANIKYFVNGIWLDSSSNNSISGNNMTHNGNGIGLYSSFSNSISGNVFIDCGLFVDDSYGTVVVDNLVNGKPLVYLEGVSSIVVADAGQVVLVNCTGIRVENLNLSHTSVGVQVWGTSNTTISGNYITTNMYGILLDYSSNNSISGNNITNGGIGIRFFSSSNNSISGNYLTTNMYGIWLSFSSSNSISGNYITNNRDSIYLDSSSNNNSVSGNNITNNFHIGILLASSNNSIYHNNFNNTQQVSSDGTSTNVWDDGYPSGGNYWSDYNGTDDNHDGIGDTPYVIDANNTDNYPLMTQYAIPEFPSFLILPLFMLVTLLGVIVYRRRRENGN